MKIYSYISDADVSRSNTKTTASLDNPSGVQTPEIPIAGQNEVIIISAGSIDAASFSLLSSNWSLAPFSTRVACSGRVLFAAADV